MPPIMWPTFLLFGALAGNFLYKATVRSASRTWSWGRGGGTVPLSRFSYAVWGLTFVYIMALTGVRWQTQPPIAFGGLLCCFIAVIVAGMIDSYRFKPIEKKTAPIHFNKRKRRLKKYRRHEQIS